MGGSWARRKRVAAFAALVVLAEVVGRSATNRVDRALHVRPLAPSGANYYPFLLVGVKVVAALLLAAVLARVMRAHAAAQAGDRILSRLGQQREEGSLPRLQLGLSPRVWLLAFAGTALAYLVQADAEGLAAGRWPLFSPWLHTYALPVFAALSVLVAVAWSLASWLRAVEEHGERTLAYAHRILHAALRAVRSRRGRPLDDAGPRRRFGLAFESRPPPFAA
jgi:hypothetical protein